MWGEWGLRERGVGVVHIVDKYNTGRWVKGGGRRFLSKIEPNFQLPYWPVAVGWVT